MFQWLTVVVVRAMNPLTDDEKVVTEYRMVNLDKFEQIAPRVGSGAYLIASNGARVEVLESAESIAGNLL